MSSERITRSSTKRSSQNHVKVNVSEDGTETGPTTRAKRTKTKHVAGNEEKTDTKRLSGGTTLTPSTSSDTCEERVWLCLDHHLPAHMLDPPVEFPPCWGMSVGRPIRDMVYDPLPRCLWVRLGTFSGQQPGSVWKIGLDSDCKLLRKGIGMVTPQEVVSGIADGYGLCVDTKRRALVICDKRSLKVVDYEGKHIQKVYLKGAGDVSNVCYCSEKDQYIIGHSTTAIWEVDAATMTLIKPKRKHGLRTAHPWRMSHLEDPCVHYVSTTDRIIHITQIGYMNTFCSTYKNNKMINYLDGPAGICWDTAGSLLVCDHGNGCVRRKSYDEGGFTKRWEVILPVEKVPGGKPSCVAVVDDRFVLVSSSDTKPGRITCYQYSPALGT